MQYINQLLVWYLSVAQNIQRQIVEYGLQVMLDFQDCQLLSRKQKLDYCSTNISMCINNMQFKKKDEKQLHIEQWIKKVEQLQACCWNNKSYHSSHDSPTTEESYEHFSGEMVGRPLVLTNKLTTTYQSYYLLLLSKTPSFIAVQAHKQNIHHICPTFKFSTRLKIATGPH